MVDKLAGVAQKAMQAPESAAAMVKQGSDPHFLGPDPFAAFIASEKARWSAVASAAALLSKS
jgi:tripartite-type tricarboxylate transporter receptor subunit TctC